MNIVLISPISVNDINRKSMGVIGAGFPSSRDYIKSRRHYPLIGWQ